MNAEHTHTQNGNRYSRYFWFHFIFLYSKLQQNFSIHKQNHIEQSSFIRFHQNNNWFNVEKWNKKTNSFFIRRFVRAGNLSTWRLFFQCKWWLIFQTKFLTNERKYKVNLDHFFRLLHFTHFVELILNFQSRVTFSEYCSSTFEISSFQFFLSKNRQTIRKNIQSRSILTRAKNRAGSFSPVEYMDEILN